MLSKFCEKTHLGIVWLVWFIVFVLLWYGIMELLTAPTKHFWIIMKMGLIMGLLMSGFITMIFGHMRRSDKVWGNLKAFNTKMVETTNPVEFEKLYDELNTLRSECIGIPHYDEIRRLRSVMDMKKQYLK